MKKKKVNFKLENTNLEYTLRRGTNSIDLLHRDFKRIFGDIPDGTVSLSIWPIKKKVEDCLERRVGDGYIYLNEKMGILYTYEYEYLCTLFPCLKRVGFFDYEITY